MCARLKEQYIGLIFFSIILYLHDILKSIFETPNFNRLETVLVEKNKTGKWIAE